MEALHVNMNQQMSIMSRLKIIIIIKKLFEYIKGRGYVNINSIDEEICTVTVIVTRHNEYDHDGSLFSFENTVLVFKGPYICCNYVYCNVILTAFI